MLNISFYNIGLSTFQILILGCVGYGLSKAKVIKEENLRTLSYLVVHVFLPSLIFVRFIEKFSFAQYPQWWIFPLMSLIITVGGFLVGEFVSLLFKDLKAKNEFLALVSFQNSGYIPLIIAVQVFPSDQAAELLVYIFLFLIGFDFAIWSLGVSLLVGKEKKGFHIKDALTPPFYATTASLLIVFLGLDRLIPQALIGPTEMLGACALPIAILIVGGNLAFMSIRSKEFRKEIFLAVFAKVFLLPVLALGCVYFFQIKGLIGFLIVLESVVPSATTLVVIVKHFQVQEKYISQGIFYTHIAGLLAIPFFLMFYLKIITLY